MIELIDWLEYFSIEIFFLLTFWLLQAGLAEAAQQEAVGLSLISHGPQHRQVPRVTCHVSPVMHHVSCITCHVTCVTQQSQNMTDWQINCKQSISFFYIFILFFIFFELSIELGRNLIFAWNLVLIFYVYNISIESNCTYDLWPGVIFMTRHIQNPDRCSCDWFLSLLSVSQLVSYLDE